MQSGIHTGSTEADAETLAAALLRSPGRSAMFAPGSESLAQLVRYLAQPGSTYAQAAQDFGCSLSTVEKVIARERKKLLAGREKKRKSKKAPVPCTDTGAAQTGDESPATQSSLSTTEKGVA